MAEWFWMINTNKHGRKLSWQILRYYPKFCLKRLKQLNICHNNQFMYWDLNMECCTNRCANHSTKTFKETMEMLTIPCKQKLSKIDNVHSHIPRESVITHIETSFKRHFHCDHRCMHSLSTMSCIYWPWS
jgi:hypothetical protein